MKNILFGLILISSGVFAQQQYGTPEPRDLFNTPIYGGLGLPFYATIATTGTTYVVGERAVVPLTGIDLYRPYRHILMYNPSLVRTAFICIGDSTGCSTDMASLPPGYSIVMDSILYGFPNNKTHIYSRLDAAAAVSVQVGGW